jgi:acetyltransferase
MRLIGPNSLGLMMPKAKLNASFAAKPPNQGHLALISESGGIAAAMVDWVAERSVGFSGIVSTGDQVDVDVADFLTTSRRTRAPTRSYCTSQFRISRRKLARSKLS